MFINNSHKDPETTRKINESVGTPYCLKERFKLKGIGSPKMPIVSASPGIYNILVLDQNSNFCNIELRPKGIIIGFQKRLETYNLVIPYYKLTLYKGKSDVYSFHKDNYFIKVRITAKDNALQKFISKILNEKAKQDPPRLEDM